MSFSNLRGADEKREATGWSQESSGYGQNVGEAFDRAECNYIENLSDGLGADVLYIDTCQSEGTGDFAEEGGFLVVGFDEGHAYIGSPKLYRDAGEAGTGA